MKVLVLGAGGMAGHVVALYLREQGLEVETLSANNKLDLDTYLINVLDIEKFKSFLDSKKYDIVINCIGVLVQQSEERKDLAVYINSYFPHFLETYYNNSKTRIIHLSTDCVFSSNNPPYYENSEYDGQLFYDRSKALGEIINDKDLTFRMSIVGPDMTKKGVGLFNWFSQQSDEISGYDKFIWNGITTIELAKGIKEAIEQNLTGIYHLVSTTSISKFNLLQLFKEVFGRKDIKITPNSDTILDRTLINTRHDFDFVVPDYKTMVEEMRNWVESHKDLYQHYL